jgi:putative hydrolase of the HAD superfamily
MARTDSSRRWYLFDYGNVISTAPTPQDWELLTEATGVPDLQEPTSTYWQHRYGYDAAALTPEEYWSLVCGRCISASAAAWLDMLDRNQWSHPNLETLDVLEDLDARGERLALLSNMPTAMVSQIVEAPWTSLFQHLFFSSSLGLVKPSDDIFRHVLAELAVAPDMVTFIDDAPVNIAAALDLGFDARLFDPSSDLSRMLSTSPAAVPAVSAGPGLPQIPVSPSSQA